MSATLPSNLQMLLGLYAYLLPLLLYVLFSTLALWDLGRRDDLSAVLVWLWPVLIFAVPFLGPIAYLFFGGARLAPRIKLMAVGGVAAYLLVWALGASVGGIT